MTPEARLAAVIKTLANVRLMQRDRIVLAWFQAIGDWRSIKEAKDALSLSKNAADVMLLLYKLGYLQRERVGPIYMYAAHGVAKK